MAQKMHNFKNMKLKILKFSTLIFLLLFLGGSCQKDDLEYADESIVISTYPGIAIYKTKKDYSKYLAVCLDNTGNLSCTPLFGNDPNIVHKNSKDEFVLNNRLFLSSDYILEDIYTDYAFTDITIAEMVEKFTNFGANYWSPEKYENRIIDRDPFLEFYYLDATGQPESYTIGEINEMIESGTFKTVFKKLK